MTNFVCIICSMSTIILDNIMDMTKLEIVQAFVSKGTLIVSIVILISYQWQYQRKCNSQSNRILLCRSFCYSFVVAECHQATYGSEINCVNYLSDVTLLSFRGGEFKHNYKGIIMVIKYINCHFPINISYRHSWYCTRIRWQTNFHLFACRYIAFDVWGYFSYAW
jgi:hypothetical protein